MAEIPLEVVEDAVKAYVEDDDYWAEADQMDEVRADMRRVLSAVLVEVDCPTCGGIGKRRRDRSWDRGPGDRGVESGLVPCTAPGCAGTGRLLVVERRRTHECDG